MGNSCIKQTTKEKNIFSNFGLIKNKSVVLIDWNSDTETNFYHWWPMKESKMNDKFNNLYAEGGGLYKYDQLFHTKSIEYQKENYCIQRNSDRTDKNWAGFCDKATMLSCMYEYPKYTVVVDYQGKKQVFDKFDIENLMMIASENTIKKGFLLFLGKRYNTSNDDKNEPYPLDLLKMLNIISLENEPFAIDVDNTTSVWNYAFDSIKVTKGCTCGIHHVKPELKFIEYYNFKITSKAYPKQNIDIWGYIGYDDTNDYTEKKNIKQGWISKIHPDFIWKVYKSDTIWQGPCNINPQINAEIVHRIYTESLKQNNKIINLDIFKEYI
jgi:hypothetical protein